MQTEPQEWRLPQATNLYKVLHASNCLELMSPPDQVEGGSGLGPCINGSLLQVRVTCIHRGPHKRSILLFYGKLDSLSWDPDRFIWEFRNKRIPFLDFTVGLGWSLLNQKHVIPNPIERKWQGVFPLTFWLRWKIVWAKQWTSNEASLLWLI
jgi:hypothetical protein